LFKLQWVALSAVLMIFMIIATLCEYYARNDNGEAFIGLVLT